MSAALDYQQALAQGYLPIREVARGTGVNPVTLRAWERRYGLVVPYRTAKGHRLYAPEQIERIHQVLTWLNRGVAPFYYAWPIELSLAGPDGAVAYAQQAAADVRTFLLGRTETAETLRLPDTLAPGEYTLFVAILDPATGQPAIHLNMEGGGDSLRFPLYPIKIQ